MSTTRVITPEFRASFPQVFKPKAMPGGGAEKFSINMLFDKKTDLSALKKAAQEALTEKWGDKPPKGLKSPFKDGNEKEYDGYADTIVVSATSKVKPGLVDEKLQPIISESDFYAGCYARASIRAFTYDTNGNRGVSFALENVQKLRDGEAFSGRQKAEDVFTVVDADSENPSNYDFM